MSASLDTAKPSHSGHILALDGVRGLAILLVTIYRFSKEAFPESLVGSLFAKLITVGSLGVDLFFVLSGFLITGILLRTKDAPSYFSQFYYRRSLRIFPLYFMTLGVLLVALPLIAGSSPSLFPEATKNQFYLWTYLANWKMSWENQWCFGYLDHLWSLAVEEQFYLVWPFVVIYASRRLLSVAFWGVGICVLARAAVCVFTSNVVAPEVFTLLRCDGLLLGAVIAVLWRADPSLQMLSRWGLPSLCVSAVFFIVAGLAGGRMLGIPHFLIAIFWASFLVMVLTPTYSLVTRCMEWQFLTTLGKYSYAMYMFQSPLVPIMRPMFDPSKITSSLSYPLLAGSIYVVAMFSLTYCLAYVSWHVFESVFLRYKEVKPKAEAVVVDTTPGSAI